MGSVKIPAPWLKEIKGAPDPDRVRRRYELLVERIPELRELSEAQVGILAKLFSGSEVLPEWLGNRPHWIKELTPDALRYPRAARTLRKEVDDWLPTSLQSGDFEVIFSRVREIYRREMLRIAARDLARMGTCSEITKELSNLADLCLSTITTACLKRLELRLGRPHHEQPDRKWIPTPFTVIGLGKLGGQELNYSSDVDLIFVYADEGHTWRSQPRTASKPDGTASNHQFFNRVAEAIVAESTRLTSEGTMYRVDLRLRPEGDHGPLTRSLEAYENYYASQGQTWERMMLIKARHVGGDASLAGEFQETIHTFRYPRFLRDGIRSEIASVKLRIESEVLKADELDRNVKLGRGGIREIEFIAQTLQLIFAGRNPFLQGPSTLPCIEKLVQYTHLKSIEGKQLTDAYEFLRSLEHRLQMEACQQTHTLPADSPSLERLARSLGFNSKRDLEQCRKGHSKNVRAIYDRIIGPPPAMSADDEMSRMPIDVQGHSAEWKAVFESHHFRKPEQATGLLREFFYGPGFGVVSQRTTELALGLAKRLLLKCPPWANPFAERDGLSARTPSQRFHQPLRHEEKPADASKRSLPPQCLSDPDRVLARLDAFVSAYGTRALLYETWTSNPSLFDLLLLLFDRSEFLAEKAIATPDLVDDLVLGGHLRRRKDASTVLGELRLGQTDDDQKLWIRRYHRSELMRVGLRDILGLSEPEQHMEELSSLAEACLQYAVETVQRKNRMAKPPFAIVALGKFGGAELNYGSDLDVVFVAPDSSRNLSRLQMVATSVIDLLSSSTEMGVAFEIDARLRPDGEKGLLVNTLGAYTGYYRQRALVWEIQALTRVRAVAGDEKSGIEFVKMAAKFTDLRATREKPAGREFVASNCGSDWRSQIKKMRERIERERTPAGQNALAIKTGAGGLIDAEFIAQVLCLANGWHIPNTFNALARASESYLIPANKGASLLEDYRSLRRIEAILRRWSNVGETLLPSDPAALHRVALRCGYPAAEQFLEAVNGWRKGIRAAYDAVMDTST